MADKRMFTKKITESDSFLEMPLSTQCLYFHLNMEADDDGFVNAPKKTMRMIGASEDDLKLLIGKRFVLVFDSGIIVIKHWRMHNTLQKDRYHPTDYQQEFRQLALKENKAYTMSVSSLETDWKQNGNILETEIRLDKTRLDKNRLEEINDDDIQIQRAREAGLAVDEALEALSPYDYTVEEVCDLAFRITDGQIRNPAAYVARYKQ